MMESWMRIGDQRELAWSRHRTARWHTLGGYARASVSSKECYTNRLCALLLTVQIRAASPPAVPTGLYAYGGLMWEQRTKACPRSGRIMPRSEQHFSARMGKVS